MYNLFSSPGVEPLAADPLPIWRQQIVVLLLRILLLIGTPLILFDTLNEIAFARWPIVWWNLSAWTILIGLTLARRVDYRIRAAVLVGLFLVSALLGLRSLGLYGINPTMAITSIVLALLLLGPRIALVVAALVAAGIALIFSGFALGAIAYPYESLQHVTSVPVLLNNGLLIMGFATLLALVVGSLLRALQSSLRTTQAAQVELGRVNGLLEATIERRTLEVQQTTALLEATQRVARVGGSLYNPQDETLTWTDELYRIHEVPPGHVLDRALIAELYPGDAWPKILAAYRRLVADGSAYELELPAVTLSGRPIWVRISGEVELVDGMPRYIGAVQDITAHKEAELHVAEQLRHAEALAHCSRILLVGGSVPPDWQPLIQQAIQRLREAVGCTRLDLNFFPAASGIFELPALNLADQHAAAPPFRNLPVDPHDIPSALLDALRRGAVISGTTDDLLPPPSTANTAFSANELRSLLLIGVHIAGIWRGYLVASDSLESRRWEEPTVRLLRTGLEMIAAFIQQWETTSALRDHEAQLRAAGDNLPNGFVYQYRYDEQLHPSFSYLSSGVQQVLGVTPAAGLDDANVLNRLIAPEERERVHEATLRSHAELSIFTDVVRYLRSNGEECWLYLSSRPRSELDGSVVWDGVALDITAHQRAAEELARARDAAEAATRAKSAFLANMSHEIRTPLNAVIGMGALLQDTELTDEQRLFAATIHSGGKALLSVINDILDFSRIESGHVDLEAEPFDLPACLHTAVDLISHEARHKGVSVRCTLAPDLPRAVVGDAGRLSQVLLNLLGNAVKFTDQGEIALCATAVAHNGEMVLVQITVRDSGIGMGPDQLERVFAPFVQADNTTARRYGGSGLGLTISRQLVVLMGGTIAVDSAPAQGSTFTITLPFKPAPLSALERSVVPLPAATQALRVLVAEDNPVNQEVMRRMVGRLGHTVTIAADGQVALDALTRQVYDVVLMDMQMPVLDGVAATRAIRACPAIAVQPYIIALTANALDSDRERALQAGMDDYLSKPVQPEELQRALAGALVGRNDAGDAPAAGPVLGAPEVLIDWAALDQLCEVLGPDAAASLEALIDLFAELVPEQLNTIQSALAQGDAVRIAQEAHHLRGGALQLGATALAALAYRLEHTEALDATAAALLERLRICYAETLVLLRRRYPLR